MKRDDYLNRKSTYLRRSFDEQMQVLQDIERERSIQLQSIKSLTQLHVQPINSAARIIPADYVEVVKQYEYCTRKK